jgi:hemoglobin
MSLTESQLAGLVNAFYAKVREDDFIGPVFNGAVHDWPDHLKTLASFWSGVMLKTGDYRGNPMSAHAKHVAEISPPIFVRWLELWRETTNEMFAPEDAAVLQERATRIGQSLQFGLDFERKRQN